MKRRNFLKTITIGAIALSVPIGFKDDKEPSLKIGDKVRLRYGSADGKIVTYTGGECIAVPIMKNRTKTSFNDMSLLSGWDDRIEIERYYFTDLSREIKEATYEAMFELGEGVNLKAI